MRWPAIVVGCPGIFPGEHGGEAAGAADVLRDRGGGDAEVVEQHVPLALVVPLGVVVVLVVKLLSESRMPAADDAVVAEPRDRVVLLQRQGQELLAAAEGVEQAPVVEHLVQVVDVVGVVRDAPGLGVLLDMERRRLVDGVDQAPLQDRPLRRRPLPGRRNRNHAPVHSSDHLSGSFYQRLCHPFDLRILENRRPAYLVIRWEVNQRSSRSCSDCRVSRCASSSNRLCSSPGSASRSYSSPYGLSM